MCLCLYLHCKQALNQLMVSEKETITCRHTVISLHTFPFPPLKMGKRLYVFAQFKDGILLIDSVEKFSALLSFLKKCLPKIQNNADFLCH